MPLRLARAIAAWLVPSPPGSCRSGRTHACFVRPCRCVETAPAPPAGGRHMRLRQYASVTLPKLREHLGLARSTDRIARNEGGGA